MNTNKVIVVVFIVFNKAHKSTRGKKNTYN